MKTGNKERNEAKARVQRRYELASKPYQAQRRNFTSKKVSLHVSLLKGLVWASL